MSAEASIIKPTYQEINKALKLDVDGFIARHWEIAYSGEVPNQLPFASEVLFAPNVRHDTYVVQGGALGDEGKGRLVTNFVDIASKNPGIDRVYVIRTQGGNNAGHTVEKNGVRVALHVIPSGIFNEKAIMVMDKGMIIHPEDLITEIEDVESKTGRLLNGDNLRLAENAILCTDLERARETLDSAMEGKTTRGGTGRGIGPSYADYAARKNLTVRDLLNENWREKLSKRYDDTAKLMLIYEAELHKAGVTDTNLQNMEVPDFRNIVSGNGSSKRMVGTKEEFLEKLGKARDEIIRRGIVVNTLALHEEMDTDEHAAVVVEIAQATGLDIDYGTKPDTTSSTTTVWGIPGYTGYWTPNRFGRVISAFKATYTSSVGARKMPTDMRSSANIDYFNNQGINMVSLADWITDYAHEYGTSTGRKRDIDAVDLPMFRYNLMISGATEIQLTHLDVTREGDQIPVCTHYTNRKGEIVPYNSNLGNLAELTPHYILLPGWDGEACRNAKCFAELPENARRYLTFIQLQLGSYPITAVTTGPDTANFIDFSAGQ